MSDSGLTPIPTERNIGAMDAQSDASATAGQLLHNARQAASLSLEELAARVKVPVARLQALEDDRFDSWPDMNVVRAVAAGICRHVRLDPAVVLSRLPKAEKMVWSSAVADSPVGFRDKDGFKMRSSSGLGRLPLALLTLALALGALGLYLGPAVEAWIATAWAGQGLTVAPAVPEPVLPPDAAPTDTRLGAMATEVATSSPLQAGESPSASVAVRGGATALPAPQLVPFSSAGGALVEGKVSSAQTVAPSSPLLVFKAQGLSWVAVTDAKGVVLLRKTLAAGETASADGALPLWVVVGRADKTEVQVRGQPLKLEPSGPENVARFKVQ